MVGVGNERGKMQNTWTKISLILSKNPTEIIGYQNVN